MENKPQRTRKKAEINLNSMIYGKVPPQAKELEEAILGGIILEPSKFTEVNEILKSDDFYLDAHIKLYKCMVSLVKKRTPIDYHTLIEELKIQEYLESVGGVYFVVKITNNVGSTANIKTHCFIVKQKSVQRKLIELSGIIISRSYEDSEDVFNTLEEAESLLKSINNELSELSITPISNVVMNVISDFETKVYNAKHDIKNEKSIYTNFKEWDEVNGELFGGLYVVAGRPAMGKGVHMVECICRMAKTTDIGVINGEMTNEQLLKRIGCNLKGIDNNLFRKDKKYVTDDEIELLKEAMEEAMNLKIHLDNNRRIDKILNKIRLWVEKHGVKCVFADFLTLFKVPSDLERYFTKTQQVDYILDGFAEIAKVLKIPIILYVQMNREILGRAGTKEPNLGDLKQSGSIEELAYQVSFLHRPEYYDPTSITDENGESTKDLCLQIIAKHRDGKLKRIKYKADLAKSRLTDWEDDSVYGQFKNNFKDVKF